MGTTPLFGARALRIAAVASVVVVGAIARLSVDEKVPRLPSTGTGLSAIECLSVRSCVAVGSIGGVFKGAPYVMVLEDGAWIDRSPSVTPQFGDSGFSSVKCLGTKRCVAVGGRDVPTRYFADRSAGDRPLTGEWDGAEWRLDFAALPPHTREATLRGVDCASSFCIAVGDYERRGREKTRALGAAWDGSAWSVDLPARIRGIEDIVLDDIACPTSRACIAVGYFMYEFEGMMTFGFAPMIQRWTATMACTDLGRPYRTLARCEA